MKNINAGSPWSRDRHCAGHHRSAARRVLKGQELIYNQKVKSTYDSYRQYTDAMYGYQTATKHFPGMMPTRPLTASSCRRAIRPSSAARRRLYQRQATSSASMRPITRIQKVCQANYHLRLAGSHRQAPSPRPTHSAVSSPLNDRPSSRIHRALRGVLVQVDQRRGLDLCATTGAPRPDRCAAAATSPPAIPRIRTPSPPTGPA